MRDDIDAVKKSIIEDQFRGLMWEHDVSKVNEHYQPSEKYRQHLKRMEVDKVYSNAFKSFLQGLDAQQRYVKSLSKLDFDTMIKNEMDRRKRILES